jgi:hypothetical protein
MFSRLTLQSKATLALLPNTSTLIVHIPTEYSTEETEYSTEVHIPVMVIPSPEYAASTADLVASHSLPLLARKSILMLGMVCRDSAPGKGSSTATSASGHVLYPHMRLWIHQK